MKRPFRIYVSGQMRGLPDHGKTRFDLAEQHFREMGHEVFVPGRGCSEVMDLRSIFLTDMTVILCWADAVVLVEREVYHKSKGALAEVTTALAAGVSVWQPVTDPEGGTMIEQIEGSYRRVDGFEGGYLSGLHVVEGIRQTLTTDEIPSSLYRS